MLESGSVEQGNNLSEIFISEEEANDILFRIDQIYYGQIPRVEKIAQLKMLKTTIINKYTVVAERQM